jgi:hypothetical protein
MKNYDFVQYMYLTQHSTWDLSTFHNKNDIIIEIYEGLDNSISLLGEES